MSLDHHQSADVAVGTSSFHQDGRSQETLQKGGKGWVGDSLQRLLQHKLSLTRLNTASSRSGTADSAEDSDANNSFWRQRAPSSSGDSCVPSSTRRGSASTKSTRRGSSQTDLESQRAELSCKGKRPDLKPLAILEDDSSSVYTNDSNQDPSTPQGSDVSPTTRSAPAGALTFQEALEAVEPSAPEPRQQPREEFKHPVLTEISTSSQRPHGGRSRAANSFKPFGGYNLNWLRPRSNKNKYPDYPIAYCVQVTQEITVEIQNDPDYRPPAQPNSEDGAAVAPWKHKEYPDSQTHHELFGGAPFLPPPPPSTQPDEEAQERSRPAWKKHSPFAAGRARRQSRQSKVLDPDSAPNSTTTTTTTTEAPFAEKTTVDEVEEDAPPPPLPPLTAAAAATAAAVCPPQGLDTKPSPGFPDKKSNSAVLRKRRSSKYRLRAKSPHPSVTQVSETADN